MQTTMRCNNLISARITAQFEHAEHADSYGFQLQSDTLLIYKQNVFAFFSQWDAAVQPQLKNSIQQHVGPVLADTGAEKWIF